MWGRLCGVVGKVWEEEEEGEESRKEDEVKEICESESLRRI